MERQPKIPKETLGLAAELDSSAGRNVTRFEHLSMLYMQMCLEPLSAQCPKWQDDPWDSIRFFLWGYAFEHQGRSQDFGPAAADAILNVTGRTPDPSAAKEAWEAFSKALSGRGLNCAINPLCPQGTPYKHKGATELHTRKPSVIEFAVETVGAQSLVAWALGRIKDGATQEAHTALCRINGIGPKIASLFLRDVVVHEHVSPRNNDRKLLQPVDVWVRLAARRLSGQPTLDDPGCAEYLAGKSAQPERLNQGIWYFSAKIADSSQYLVCKALADESVFFARVGRHLEYLKKGSVAAGRFESECPVVARQPVPTPQA